MLRIVKNWVCNNPNLDLVSINSNKKIGQFLPKSQDTEQKQNFDDNQVP